MAINDEFDEAEKLDSYQEPEPEVEQSQSAEETASDEEVATEDQQIGIEAIENPETETDPVGDVPDAIVESPELEILSAPASQAPESFPSPDEVEERSPDVPEPPELGEAGVEIAEAPVASVESPEVSESPTVQEDSVDVQPAPEMEAVGEDSDGSVVPVEDLSYKPDDGWDSVPAVEESVEEQADVPQVEESSPEVSVPVVDESAADLPEVAPPAVERAEFEDVTTPSASVEPLSAPPVIEDEAPSETLQEVVDDPVGFQGETNHPDVPETVSTIQQSDSASEAVGDNDKAVFAQMQQAQQSADSLAKSLVANLDPMFEQMRTSQEFAVQDYMQRQLVETTIISRIK